ncbi:AAA family ATPase [Marinifilum flexuosum]|uniref:AAA family ATPase n=1 Tax=Marinifilum flexuosum TaxID=1117708 RepID=UPI0024908C66|nr:AAA family ATPase [Marinifilum flexuosum]
MMDILSSLINGHNLEQTNQLSTKQLNLESYIVHIDEKIQEPDPLICIGNTPIFTRGNISIVGGKQKSRKTFFVCMPIVSVLTGSYGIFSTKSSSNLKVLFFDCEQSRKHSLRALKCIYKMAKFPEDVRNGNLILYSFREFSVNERKILISKAIQEQKPDFVIVDGLVDITIDFNSIEKSSETIQLLMMLSSKYNCHICSILHENKGDGNLRGHLGSIASQKAETVIQLADQGEYTKVEGTYTRDIGFDPFSFRITPELLPEISVIKSKNEIQLDEITKYFKQILEDKAISFSQLVKDYSKVSGKANPTTKKHIKKAKELGIIYVENKLYRCH